MPARTTSRAGLFACAVLVGAVPGESRLAAQTLEERFYRHAPWDESAKLTKALARIVEFPGIEDKKTDLEAILIRLQKKYHLSFDVNHDAFKDAKIRDVLKTKVAEEAAIPPFKTTLGIVLKKILSRVPGTSPATILIRRETIEITTEAAWLRELGLPEETDFNNLVKKQFRKVELRRALEEIGGGSVLIDVRVVKKTRTEVSARLWYVPAATALELLADMAGLAVVRRKDVFYITSPANAARMKKGRASREPLEGPGNYPAFFRTGLHTPGAWKPGITLRRALEATGEDDGVNVLIDPRVASQLRGRLNIRQFSAPTATTLELFADMAGLAVVKKSNVYYVTSPGNADRIRKENARPPVMEAAK